MKHYDVLGKSLVVGLILLIVGTSVGAALSVPSVCPQRAGGSTLYVGGGGPGNYTSIQAAINNATNGDTVYVFNGTYHENLDTKLKKITLEAESHSAVITGPTVSSPVVKIGTDDVTVTGFTITGTTNQVCVQVMSLAQNDVISENIIQNGGYGITLMITTSRATISYNVIQNIGIAGIQLQTSTYNTIKFNVVKNNGGQGLSLALSSAYNSITNNSILGNTKEGIMLDGVKSSDNTIMGNNISGNEVGIRMKSSGSNKVQSNNIRGSTMEGMLLVMSNENTITVNNFINNKRQAAFRLSSRNTWDSNYWSNWIGFKYLKAGFQKLPKAVHGLVLFTFDMHPAKVPYNITGFP